VTGKKEPPEIFIADCRPDRRTGVVRTEGKKRLGSRVREGPIRFSLKATVRLIARRDNDPDDTRRIISKRGRKEGKSERAKRVAQPRLLAVVLARL